MNITDYNWSTDTTTCENLIDAVNWLNLQEYASRLHQDEACNAEPPIGMGGRHFVRILTFKGGDRWLARFPIRSNDTNETVMLQEAGILRIVAEHSTVPVPKVFATVPRKAEFGVAFMLMDCLPGNVGVDVNDGIVPQKYKSRFFKQMANAQVQMSNIVFPRIGTPLRLDDGTINIGPIPGIGGPFDTASAFFLAWAASTKFPHSEQKVREDCGPYGDEIWESTSNFPARLSRLSSFIAGPYDSGPFPLVHVDYGHNNIVVDTEYNMLGVIDFENAIAAPWIMVEYPLGVRVTPAPMDLPSNYSPDGFPNDADLISKYKDREQYLQELVGAEIELGMPPRLSGVLSNGNIRDIAAAMKLFAVDGKMGWYSRVLDRFESAVES